MLDSVVPWLDQVASSVFWWCVATVVLVDAVAVGAVLMTRSRALVDRWTGRVLAANLVLLGAGLGVPAVAYTAKLAASAFAPAFSSAASAPSSKAESAPAVEPPPFSATQR